MSSLKEKFDNLLNEKAPIRETEPVRKPGSVAISWQVILVVVIAAFVVLTYTQCFQLPPFEKELYKLQEEDTDKHTLVALEERDPLFQPFA